MCCDTHPKKQERLFVVEKKQREKSDNEEGAQRGMYWIKQREKIFVEYPFEDKCDFTDIWDECTDDDEADFKFCCFPSDPTDKGVGEPIRHVVSSARNATSAC